MLFYHFQLVSFCLFVCFFATFVPSWAVLISFISQVSSFKSPGAGDLKPSFCIGYSFHVVVVTKADSYTNNHKLFCALMSVMYFRFVCGMVYYGVYLSTPNVGGNLYLNFFLTSFIEVFCLPIIIWSSDRYWIKLLFLFLCVKPFSSMNGFLNDDQDWLCTLFIGCSVNTVVWQQVTFIRF